MAASRGPPPRSPPDSGRRMRPPDAAARAQGARWRRRRSPWTRARGRWARRAAPRTRTRARLRWAGAGRRACATPPRDRPSPAAAPAARRARPRRAAAAAAAAAAAGRARAAARMRARAWRRCWRRCSRAAAPAAAARWAGRRAPRPAAPYPTLSLARARTAGRSAHEAGLRSGPTGSAPRPRVERPLGLRSRHATPCSRACATCPRDGQARPGWRTPAELALHAESAHRAASRPSASAHPGSGHQYCVGGRAAGGG